MPFNDIKSDFRITLNAVAMPLTAANRVGELTLDIVVYRNGCLGEFNEIVDAAHLVILTEASLNE